MSRERSRRPDVAATRVFTVDKEGSTGAAFRTLGPTPGSSHRLATASAYGACRSAISHAAPPPGFPRRCATEPVMNLALRPQENFSFCHLDVFVVAFPSGIRSASWHVLQAESGRCIRRQRTADETL